MSDRRPQLGVNVAGFLRSGLGLGEAARLYVAALSEAGIPVRTTTVGATLPPVVNPSDRQAAAKTTEFADLETDADTPFNLVCVNAPELPQFYADVGPEFFDRKRTLGVWAWEAQGALPDLSRPVEIVDEIWVYSSYVQKVFEGASVRPVIRMPLPVVPRAAAPDAAAGARSDFTFLFLFDFLSTMQRKNPLGLIDAFARAFGPDEGPRLVLNSFNGDYKPERLRTVERAAARHPHIDYVDHYLPAAEKDALMASCDCYVSLHRAEGFGLTLAEAMALGKPVVATGYSGNMDFMTEENSYLVRHALTDVGPEGEHYPAAGRWAEPDLDHAAAQMRAVWEDREGAAARAERGRADVLEQLSLERVGAMAKDRLEELRQAGLTRLRSAVSRRPPPAVVGPLDEAEDDIGIDLVGLARQSGGPKGVWRELALRAMRPYSAYQDGLNRKTVEGLREVADRLTDLYPALGYAERDDLRPGTSEYAEQQFAERQYAHDLARLIASIQTRPGSTHPAISYRDGAGQLVLGFDVSRASRDETSPDFADIFRGDEELIRERQQIYADILGDSSEVLDLGCGRGEFLDLLRERGCRGRGVELSEDMVHRCREKGHDVELADALDYLRNLRDGSVPAIFTAQVVEHLPSEVLVDLLTLVEAKLEEGGTAILETVNPHAPSALKAFWTDPTHQHPLFPETLMALCRFAGFARGRVVFPEPSGDFNRDLYDNSDYAVVVTKRGSA